MFYVTFKLLELTYNLNFEYIDNVSRTYIFTFTAADALLRINCRLEVAYCDSLNLTDLSALHASDTADFANLIYKCALIAVGASYNSLLLKRNKAD